MIAAAYVCFCGAMLLGVAAYVTAVHGTSDGDYVFIFPAIGAAALAMVGAVLVATHVL